VVDVLLDDVVRFEQRGIIPARPAEVATLATRHGASAVMLWDADLDLPSAAVVRRLLEGPCHVWHVGLRLGQAGRPDAWNLCHGLAMFSRDVDETIESTSWKVSLRAVILRNEVLDTLGGFDSAFDTASGSALDAGLRWITHGALVRHVPDLLPIELVAPLDSPPTVADGIRIVRRQLGNRWAAWAIFRGVRSRSMTARQIPAAVGALRERLPEACDTYGLPSSDGELEAHARVSVLVPTIGRYPYLEKLLDQLARQTRHPDEVVVIDQNPVAERRCLQGLAPNLPLRVLYLLPPGQCSARNLGLRATTGSHILFLDDDDEIPMDLIEQHLRVLASPEISVSCGLVDDRESGPAPPSEQFRKASSIFPTNNLMIRRAALDRSGLFDPTFDRGARADHDLGMRSYLAGHLHVHDPGPRVFHHHAPSGGLRAHGARRLTRGNSRNTITARHLRTDTDLYLGLRYYTADRVDADLVLSVFASLSGGGSRSQRVLRLLVQGLLLPDTWRRARKVRRNGQRLLRNRPRIPTLAHQ
jgi:glycosyltransferase involved in cell wall biosynthesis